MRKVKSSTSFFASTLCYLLILTSFYFSLSKVIIFLVFHEQGQLDYCLTIEVLHSGHVALQKCKMFLLMQNIFIVPAMHHGCHAKPQLIQTQVLGSARVDKAYLPSKCCFPLVEARKKRKTFFSHTSGSLGASVRGV